MRILLLLLLCCSLQAQTDRPWVSRPVSGYSDTIYHTVVNVRKWSLPDTVAVVYWVVDHTHKELIAAPSVVYQIDTSKYPSSLPAVLAPARYPPHEHPSKPVQLSMDSIDFTTISSDRWIDTVRKWRTMHEKKFKLDTVLAAGWGTVIDWHIDSTITYPNSPWVRPVPHHVSKKRKKKKLPARPFLGYVSTSRDPSHTDHIRIHLCWGMKLPDGTLQNMQEFNGTFRQWDSIGREYLLHKRYFTEVH